MKWLFYLLALANSGALALQHWYLPSPQPATVHTAAGSERAGPRLALISEFESVAQARELAQPAQAQAAPARNPPPSETPRLPGEDAGANCYRITGLPDEKQADALAARLRRLGAEIRGRHLQQEIETRYWVSLPPFPSRAAAEPILRRLKKGGIKDHYFVNADPNRNAISLGVFTNPQGATTRRDQVARLGLSPRMEVVEAPKSVYAITLALPTSKDIEGLELGEWAGRTEETACP